MSSEHGVVGERCKRIKIVVDEENFYLIVGSNFVHATTPYENRPENHKLRVIVDTLCTEITRAMGGLDG